MDVVIAFDQSTTHVGWSIFENGLLHNYGELRVKDYPNLGSVREFVRTAVLNYIIVSAKVTVAVESTYLAYYGGKPQVHTFETLTRTQAHIWASALSNGANEVVVITPFDAMKALTGCNNPKTKSADRKALMIKHASALVGGDIGEHAADSIGIGMAAISLLSPPLAQASLPLEEPARKSPHKRLSTV